MTGSAIRLYLDENIWRGLTEALRQHGYDSLHARDAGRAELADELQLSYAAEQGRAVLTYNIKHFIPLAELWYEAGRDHAGIVLSEELEQGELLRRVLNLLAAVSAEEMVNNIRFLQEFK